MDEFWERVIRSREPKPEVPRERTYASWRAQRLIGKGFTGNESGETDGATARKEAGSAKNMRDYSILSSG
jgi:hypothetical protein